jgi:tRNA-uridine 2-sulfurtransferase
LAGPVVVAMSGGVDSSVAAALLKEQGHEVIGVTLDMWPRQSLVDSALRQNVCCSLEAVEDARRVADRLGMPHYTLNLRDDFERTVVQNFVREYVRGRTPNPCVRCNRFVKFEALLYKARAWGATHLATGHYARVGQAGGGRFVLRKAVDLSKDQSYALSSLTQEQLAHSLFPLGEMTKAETRQIASDLGLVTAQRPESQELCFVPDDYAGFLRGMAPTVAQSGPIRNLRGEVLGTHPGIAFFTVGQRRGLGIASPQPLYVVEIIPEQNTVVVGEREDLYSSGLIAEDVNWVSIDPPDGDIRGMARMRYHGAESPTVATRRVDGALEIDFDEPQRAVSPGQTVVLYEGDAVLAGAVITRNKRSAVSDRLSAISSS